MGDVVPFNVSALNDVQDETRQQFCTQGNVAADVADLAVSVEQWRAQARRVACDLRRPVRTGLATGSQVVWAALSDWPATDAEAELMRKTMRRAVESLPDLSEVGKPLLGAVCTSWPSRTALPGIRRPG